MDLTKEAISKIVELGDVKQFTIGGREYTSTQIYPVKEPEQVKLSINTLTGFADYVNKLSGIEELVEKIIHIVDHTRVDLISGVRGVFKQRTQYITATTEMYSDLFRYNQYYDIESFVIALQTHFEETGDREKILKIVSNIKDENVKTVEDDGVTQQVTAKVGIVHKTDVIVPNPVTLKPYRTFREVEQPASSFVFRLQSGKEGMLPTCALFEADGQSWILEAIELIKEYLEGNTEDITIIA